MSEKKSISINPELFKINKRNKKTAKSSIYTGKNKKNTRMANTIKRDLMKRIKEHKKTAIESKEKEEKDNANNTKGGAADTETNGLPKSEFDKSIEYLKLLSQKRQMSKTLKNNKSSSDNDETENANININTNIGSSLSSSIPLTSVKSKDVIDPPYGVLKGGDKPTFREWRNRTVKKNHSPPVHLRMHPVIVDDNPNNTNYANAANNNTISTGGGLFSLRQEKLQRLQERIKTNHFGGNKNPSLVSLNREEILKKMHHLKKTTLRKKLALGRNKKKKTISILLKNRSTQRDVVKSHKSLKQKDINEIRTYLNKQGLLKLGSTAPNDVLRQLYESAKLAGELNNKADGEIATEVTA